MKQTKYSRTIDAARDQARYYSYRIYGAHVASIFRNYAGQFIWVPGDYDKYQGYDVITKVNSCY